MAQGSDISWCHDTWNAVVGCNLTSAGCGMPRWLMDHPGGCYAIRQANMRASNPNEKVAEVYRGLVARNDDGELDWTGEVKMIPSRLADPFRLPRNRQHRVFVVSMGDWLHPAVTDEFIARMFAVMALNPHHIFITLTKRHARLRSLLNSGGFAELAYQALHALPGELGDVKIDVDAFNAAEKLLGSRERVTDPLPPLPNVWIGVSVENQEWADRRIPALLATPAGWTRWLSCEPLIGPLDLSRYLRPARCSQCGKDWADSACGPTHALLAHDQGLHWVVVGGESGRGRSRPMHPDWPEKILDQCLASGVAFHFKQHGDWSPYPSNWPEPTPDAKQRKERQVVLYDGRFCTSAEFHYDDYPDRGELAKAMRSDCVTGRRGYLRPAAVYEVGKKKAGRLLRGREWNEYPNAPLDRRFHRVF